MATILHMRRDTVTVRLPQDIGAPVREGVTDFEPHAALHQAIARGYADARQRGPFFRSKGTDLWHGRLPGITLPAGDPVVEALSAITAFDGWRARERRRPTFDPRHRTEADRLDTYRRPFARRQLVDKAITAMLARGGVRYAGVWQTYFLRCVGEIGVFRVPPRTGRNLKPFAGQVVWVLCVDYLSAYANREYVAVPVAPCPSPASGHPAEQGMS